MDRLVDHLFVFEGNGQISDFPGNYTDLREKQKAAKAEAPKQGAEKKPVAAKTSEKESTKATFKEKKEFEEISATLEQLTAKKETYIQKINQGTENHEELMEWSIEIEGLDEKIEALEMRWLELSELDGIS
tara:strand:- start:222 stop:614 length:393 start_codon:yes stop_codon:yes gene_type:complete